MSETVSLRPGGMRERELVAYLAVISSLPALAIDMVLPGFGDVRAEFDLPADTTQLSLLITLFFVGMAVGSVTWGALSDVLGRRRVAVAALVIYAVAALVAMTASSLAVLFVARIVWGFGAGGSRVTTQAIVRDCYEGTAMARVMTLVQATFFFAPITAPLIGSALLAIGSWRWIMGFGLVSAGVALLWTTRYTESLPPERRRPLQVKPIAAGFAAVARTPVTRWYGLSLMFGGGAFFSFLASSEFVFSSIYEREDLFVWFFVGVSVFFASAAITMNRLLKRWQARQLGVAAGIWFLGFSTVSFLVIWASGGKPPLAVFVVLFGLTNAGHVAYIAVANSLALEPMKENAGTATAALTFTSMTVGTLLGNQIDRRLDDTVWAIGIGFLLYAALGFSMQLLAVRASRSASFEPPST